MGDRSLVRLLLEESRNSDFIALICISWVQKQTFGLLPEHSFSPNNIQAFTISEPCILPVFCKVIQAVGYKPPKQLFTTDTFVWLFYIYTLIQTRHCPKFHDCHTAPHFTHPHNPIPGLFLWKILDPWLVMSQSYYVKFIIIGCGVKRI